MKNLLIACSFALMSTGAFAQLTPNIGVGVGVGTTGIAIDASATITPFLGARFGVDIMPKIKVNKGLDLKTEDKNKQISQLTKEINDLNVQLEKAGLEKVDLNQFPDGNLPNRMDVQGKLSNTTWHILLDVYPIALSSFHITAGAYFGPSDIVSVYNKDAGFLKPINAYNDGIVYAESKPATDNVRKVVDQNNLKMIGAELGDYFLTPNPADNGDVEATVKVNSFRPYLGLGFGRAVPKGRLGCQFDLGVQFWGKPEIYAPTYNKATGTYQNEKLDPDNVGDDAGKVLKAISKVSVYPVLNFRLVGRIL